MIYLIGGPPKCGKTTLAKQLSEKLRIPWISTDTLQSIAWAYVDKKIRPKKFPSSVIARKVIRSNDLKYEIYSSKEIINAYRVQARTVFTAIDMMIVCEITDQHDYIIEGYHIEPQLVRKLTKRYGSKNIKSIFLIKTDEQHFIRGIKKSRTNNDWILKRTSKEATYFKIAKMVCEYSKYFKLEVKKYNLKLFEMDKNFNKQLLKAVKHFKK